MLFSQSPDLSMELSKAFNTCQNLKILFKGNIESKWLLFNVNALICTFLILELTFHNPTKSQRIKSNPSYSIFLIESLVLQKRISIRDLMTASSLNIYIYTKYK